MARLIDADELRNRYEIIADPAEWFSHGEITWMDAAKIFADMVDEAPTIDAAPVRRGKWVHGKRNGAYGIWCSRCGTGWEESLNYEVIAASHNFCPNCGADTREEEHHEQ